VIITRLVAKHALDRRIAELLAEKTEIIDGAINAAARDSAPVKSATPMVDTAALAVDAKRAQDARDAMTAATASLATMLKVEESKPDVEIEISTECPF